MNNNLKPSRNDIELKLNDLGRQLVASLNPEGFWEGRLSSSALAGAVAVAALWFDNPDKNAKEIDSGLAWLRKNINADGSFGDTPDSQGNISTSLLVYAALNLFAEEKNWIKPILEKIEKHLRIHQVDVTSPQVSETILKHYQNDLTFSVPILAMCGLCGVPGETAFSHIPQLPFELALLPRSFYRILNLSVVSYAIPALISVGILIFKKKNSGFFWKMIRRFSTGKAIKLLHKMMPQSGGYLEAIPLTAFVTLSLIQSGYRHTEMVSKGTGFLKNTQREDGGWPIDVNLSTWVTTLSVKAFRSRLNHFLNADLKNKVAIHLKSIQNREVHPFNGTPPGGWGWTYHAGSVPDGDDTPGVILALLQLQPKENVKQEVLAGCKWLNHLQNNDGGFPTFSKGWGKLPFDRSCSDLTGHCLLAISSVLEKYSGELTKNEKTMLSGMFRKSLNYLEANQESDGSWNPLWFGNQYTEGFRNPVYGTAKVTTYLKDSIRHTHQNLKNKNRLNALIEKGINFLIHVRNDDGSWGGHKNIVGTIEETALAISAIASKKYKKECIEALQWIDSFHAEKGMKAAPIGLYFSLLWYDEQMYPISACIEALTRFLDH